MGLFIILVACFCVGLISHNVRGLNVATDNSKANT